MVIGKASKVNLGSGHDYKPGWINIDIGDNLKVDIVHDISKGIPLEDNSAYEIYASHVIEHMPDTVFIMNEIYRIARHNAVVTIRLPHHTNPLAIADPTHKKLFNEASLEYFCSNKKHYHTAKEYGINANFIMMEQQVTQGAGGEIRATLKVVKE